MSQGIDPSTQIAEAMRTIYRCGLTTSTGGNISVRGDDGALWITPAGYDKGAIEPEDIVRAGETGGRHRPSSELPLHRMIYENRPDLRAVVHAHPANLVAFCICRRAPAPRLFDPAGRLCGPIAYAPYEMTGTDRLARATVDAMGPAHQSVLLENHGVLTSGATLDEALARLTALDLLAEIEVNLARLGATPEPVAPAGFGDTLPGEPVEQDSLLAELRWLDLRARQTRLIRGLGECITLCGADGRLLTLCDGTASTEATGPRVDLHTRVHANDPAIRVVISSNPPAATAFAIAGQPLPTLAIPESHVILRQVRIAGIADAPLDLVDLAHPVMLLDQLGVVVAGRSAFEAFDRLEVLEATAQALIAGASLGEIHSLSAAQVAELNRAFGRG